MMSSHAKTSILTPSVIGQIKLAAEQAAQGADPAHDYSHVVRVAASAQTIATHEQARLDVVLAAALLHEVFNLPKDHPESHRSGEVAADNAAEILEGIGLPNDLVESACECIRTHAFSFGKVPTSVEGRVLQDADRLDSIGAIGIARCFATCGAIRRPLYHPEDPFCLNREPDDKNWGLDHFYRKLLKIEQGLHTTTAKGLATQRADFLRQFLVQLGAEVGGSRVSSTT